MGDERCYMMTDKKMLNTKYEILQCATKLFLEKGYTDAYVTTIAKLLHISTGNLTFHFPTKEHILAELVKELCAFQWQAEEREKKEDRALLTTYILELVMFASVCVENPNIKDLVVAAYTHSMSLVIIRESDTQRAMRIFKEYCPKWSEMDYIQAENIASGIEYAMFRTENTDDITFEQRVTSSLDAIMKLYEVPADIRKHTLAEVMSIDYQSKGSRVFEEFCKHVERKMR